MPTRTETNFQLLGHEQELRQTILPTFEDVLKCYILIQHNTKQERDGQQSSIAENLIAK